MIFTIITRKYKYIYNITHRFKKKEVCSLDPSKGHTHRYRLLYIVFRLICIISTMTPLPAGCYYGLFVGCFLEEDVVDSLPSGV